MTDLSTAILLTSATLGGAVVGSLGSYAVARVTNLNARDGAAAERAFRGEQAALDRKHDLDLEELRLRRTARERTYPKMAEAVQEGATRLSQEALDAMAGRSSESTRDPFLTPERRQVWSEMQVFASKRTLEEWKAYLAVTLDLRTAINEAWVARQEQARTPQLVTPTVVKVEEMYSRLGPKATELMDSMRMDLTGGD